MESQLGELAGFLHDQRSDVREIAVHQLVRYSAAEANSQHIFKQDNNRAVQDLKILARDRKPVVAQDAETILSNLCDDDHIRELVVEDKLFVKLVLTQLVDLSNTNADLAAILLSNMAKSDTITSVFDISLDLKTDMQKQMFKSTRAIDCLMDLFVKGADRKLNPYATYDYLSYFFADVSRFEQGREYFITKQDYDGVVPLSKILVFTEKYDSKVRRQGVASTIKNALFDTDRQMKLVTDKDINLLPYILAPLALADNKGLSDEEINDLPDELQLLDSDKKTEPLKEINLVYLDALLLICVTRAGRQYLRDHGTYPLIREFDKEHKDEDVSDSCFRLVDMLMRDETKGEYDPKVEKQRIEEVLKKKDESEDESDSDSDDDEIVEVA